MKNIISEVACVTEVACHMEPTTLKYKSCGLNLAMVEK